MHIDTLAWPNEPYLKAMYALAYDDKLRHADDEATRFVMDEWTERIALIESDPEFGDITDRLRGRRAFGVLAHGPSCTPGWP